MTQFSSKWGVVQDELVVQPPSMGVELIAVIQFVATVLVLLLVRPPVVLLRSSKLSAPRICPLLVLLVATAAVMVTYFYPHIASSR